MGKPGSVVLLMGLDICAAGDPFSASQLQNPISSQEQKIKEQGEIQKEAFRVSQATFFLLLLPKPVEAMSESWLSSSSHQATSY